MGFKFLVEFPRFWLDAIATDNDTTSFCSTVLALSAPEQELQAKAAKIQQQRQRQQQQQQQKRSDQTLAEKLDANKKAA